MNLVNLRRAIAAAGVILTLLLACASVDAQKLRATGEDGDDVGSTLDDEATLAATCAVPALIPPPWRRRPASDEGTPVSRLAVADVFRPPQARA